MPDSEVLIVGAGLAGLSCAYRLLQAGIPGRIFEASDDVGGRARTDEVDGFLLDRGFQVLLTAYPEVRRVIDIPALDPVRYKPGALIYYQGKFHSFVDPWRCPRHFLATALSPVATVGDKLKLARFRRRICRDSLDQLYVRPETTTIEALRREGFSERIISRFFRPFLGGVFLDRDLETSSRMFEFLFRMFAMGDAVVPASGMGTIARQIAAKLPGEAVHTRAQVVKVNATSLQLADGTQVQGRSTVIACAAPAAAKLLADDKVTPGRGVTCFYFTAEKPPIREPVLVLNGGEEGPVNNLSVPSQLTPACAPPGKSLISVTVLGDHGNDEGLEAQVRNQLRDWFGTEVEGWQLVRTYPIPYALPSQAPPALSPVVKPARRSDGIFVCGDYLNIASIEGAMLSGRLAAEQIIGAQKS